MQYDRNLRCKRGHCQQYLELGHSYDLFSRLRQKILLLSTFSCGNLPKQIFNKNAAHFLFYYAIVLLKSLISNGPPRQAEDKSDRYPTQQLKVDRTETERCLCIDNIGSSRKYYDKRMRG